MNIQETSAILESISDGVFTVDENWNITSFNRAAEEITGVKRKDAIGSFCSEVFKSSMCETGCALRRTLETSKPIINKSGFIINSSGEKIPVTISTAVLRDENGKIIGGAETFRDLREVEALKNELRGELSFGSFITHSNSMKDVLELSKAVADSPSTIVISGETGTGKEVLAKSIHAMSSRKNEPFIAVNCGALPDTLLESELFGYKKGAFTGADRDREGRFSLVRNGTLFLDEIGEITPALQVRLLRVLQERCFEPLGSTKSEQTNARIIVATHRDLAKMVTEGKFRQDLFYRINVMSLQLPPLRERKEDIPLLAAHFVEKLNLIQNRNVSGITPEAYAVFMNHDWPGNVRELENLVERAFVLCGDGMIDSVHLPSELNSSIQTVEAGHIADTLRKNERDVLISALQRNSYNCAATAKKLGIHKTTLYRKLKKLNIQR